MDKIMEVEVKGKNGRFLEASLPLTPYEMLDLLDKGGLTPEGSPVCDVIDGNISSAAYTVISSDWRDLYELNALAEKLTEMNDAQRVAYDGLLKMETDKSEGPIPLGKLIDLAYSADFCDVYPGVATYEELGHFYVENDLLPELKSIPEESLPFLDYGKIGEKFSKEEGGVFASGEYVIQTSDLQKVFHTLDLKPRKPGYAILIEVTQDDRSAQLSLPSSPQAMDVALDAIGARDWGSVSMRCLDCRAPALIPAIGEEDNIAHIDRLAGMLDEMDEREFTRFKAVLDATEDYSVLGATHLATTLYDYLFSPKYLSAEDIARDYINFSMGEAAAAQLYPFVQLELYGQALMEEQECALTDYGIVSRVDGQCLKTSLGPTGPVMGGMEMT